MASESLVSKVNLNQATLGELQSLPGIGKARARAIIQHREEYGPFENVEELRGVEGVSETMFETLQDLVTVEEVPAAPPLPEEAVAEPPPAVEEPEPEEEPPALPEMEEPTPPEAETLEEDLPGPTPPEVVMEDVGPVQQPSGCQRVLTNLLLVLVGALLGTGLSLLILYAANGTLLFSHKADAAVLQAQVRALQDQNQDMSQRLVEADRKITVVQGQVPKISALAADLEQLQDQAAGLEEVFQAMRGHQDDLKRQYATLQGKFNTLLLQTDSLAERADEAEERLTALEETRSSLIQFLSALEGLLQDTLDSLIGE